LLYQVVGFSGFVIVLRVVTKDIAKDDHGLDQAMGLIGL